MDPILILCKTLLKGGAEKQALILSKQLTERNQEIILINWSGNKIDTSNKDYIQTNAINYIGLNGNIIVKLIHLQRIIKKEKIVIFLAYLTLPNFVAGICKIFNGKLKTIGGIRTEKLPYYKFIFEKMVHNYFNNATVFNSYSAKIKFVKMGFNPAKIYVIHNSILVGEQKEWNGHNKDEINIITVARFVEPKDFPTALNSFKLLIEKNRAEKFKYYVVGYGPMENEIRSLVTQLNLNKEVEIIINPPDIYDILKTCDIYLSTSLFEGLSNSIMEAMAARLPVIATEVGDNGYLIKNAFNGFIVPCRDVNLIVEKLEYLANFDITRREFGHNGYNIIKNEFSVEKMTENYFKLFSEMSVSVN